MSNFPLSEKAKEYIDKLFPCEPPCDSYGVCEHCCEKTIFRAGYNFGARSANSKIETLKSLLDISNKKADMFFQIIEAETKNRNLLNDEINELRKNK